MSEAPTPPESSAPQAAGTPVDPVLAAGVVLWADSPQEPRFLLLRNKCHGSWGLPKGHAEPDEELPVTACREVKEETGYQLHADDLRDDFADTHLYQPKPGIWKRVIQFLAAAPVEPDDFVRSDEHDEHAWLSPNDAVACVQHDALRRTLRLATARLARAAEAEE